ncbi:hypothetical protein FKB34_01065 [Glycocaulis profundi]|nr:hypothetical protein FKB34_01065 [Glycocaulis profundi]
MTRFASDRHGAMAVMFSGIVALGAVLLILVIGQIFDHLHKRALQADADLAALIAVRDQAFTPARAAQVIADQGRDPDEYEIEVVPGHYRPEPGVALSGRFQPGAQPYNAAHVRLSSPSRHVFSGANPRRASAEATAARRDLVSFSLGSRLVRLEGGYSGAVLGALLGYQGRITVMDYQALASAKIDALDYLDALALHAGLQAVSYDDVLGARVRLGDALQAAADVAGADAPPVLRALPNASARRNQLVPVADLLTIPAGRAPLPAARGTGAQVSVADILAASALAASGGRQVDVAVETGAASLRLGVGERPQSSGLQLYAAEGATADTRQLQLEVSAGGGLNLVRVGLENATAHARLVELKCGANGAVQARFEVDTSAARATVWGPSLLGLLPINVKLAEADLSDGGVVDVTLTGEHLASGRPAIVRSGLGAQVSLLGLGLPLSGLVNGVLGVADDLLVSLGLSVAEAELFLRDASCGRPYLVE